MQWASKEEVQNVVDICVEKFGKVDIIVNNAGVLYRLAQLKISVRNSGKGCWILI
ncbi:MAG: SDR family NAD(P)-dependent oxidoreductase [Coprococcus sp.]